MAHHSPIREGCWRCLQRLRNGVWFLGSECHPNVDQTQPNSIVKYQSSIHLPMYVKRLRCDKSLDTSQLKRLHFTMKCAHILWQFLPRDNVVSSKKWKKKSIHFPFVIIFPKNIPYESGHFGISPVLLKKMSISRNKRHVLALSLSSGLGFCSREANMAIGNSSRKHTIWNVSKTMPFARNQENHHFYWWYGCHSQGWFMALLHPHWMIYDDLPLECLGK